jgi:hypothetical protein
LLLLRNDRLDAGELGGWFEQNDAPMGPRLDTPLFRQEL